MRVRKGSKRPAVLRCDIYDRDFFSTLLCEEVGISGEEVNELGWNVLESEHKEVEERGQ